MLLVLAVLIWLGGVPAMGASLPSVRATFLDPGAFIPGIYPARRRSTEADVRRKVDAIHSLGIDTIIITDVEYISNR